MGFSTVLDYLYKHKQHPKDSDANAGTACERDCTTSLKDLADICKFVKGTFDRLIIIVI